MSDDTQAGRVNVGRFLRISGRGTGTYTPPPPKPEAKEEVEQENNAPEVTAQAEEEVPDGA